MQLLSTQYNPFITLKSGLFDSFFLSSFSSKGYIFGIQLALSVTYSQMIQQSTPALGRGALFPTMQTAVDSFAEISNCC